MRTPQALECERLGHDLARALGVDLGLKNSNAYVTGAMCVDAGTRSHVRPAGWGGGGGGGV